MPSAKTKPLYRESIPEFRMRAIMGILTESPEPLSSDNIAAKYNSIYMVDYRRTEKSMFQISKETVVRNLDILTKRKQVKPTRSDQDNRRRLWEPA